MILFKGTTNEKEFENRFAFIGEDCDLCYLEGKKKPITCDELIDKQIIVFTTERVIRGLAAKLKKVNMFKNKGNRILNISIGSLYFRNFNELCGYSDLNSFKKDFPDFCSDTQAELMRDYITFLRQNGIKRNEIATSTKSRIAELILYKKTEKLFSFSNNSLPKTKKEREVVFNFYKNKLIEKNGMVYGKLFHQKGYYENVLMVDLNNFYGYQLISKKYLQNNPYRVILQQEEPKYNYLPMTLRNAFLHNYKTAKKRNENGDYCFEVGYRNFYKNANNLSLGRSENIEIYYNRSRESQKSYLQPQHGFPTIIMGIEDLDNYIKIFNLVGGEMIKEDTDGLAMIGIDREKGEEIVNIINYQVVKNLIDAGISEEDAKCGIGQFKIEGYAEKYYQFGDKAYCYQENGKIKITFSGMKEEEKEEIISSSKNFEEVVEKLKTRQIQISKPIEINKKFELVEGSK